MITDTFEEKIEKLEKQVELLMKEREYVLNCFKWAESKRGYPNILREWIYSNVEGECF